jgi:hypothetical protein
MLSALHDQILSLDTLDGAAMMDGLPVTLMPL